MSRKVLSEKEYDIFQKLLIEKMTLGEAAAIYGMTAKSIRLIYVRTYKKVQSVTELLGEIDNYKHKLKQLKLDFKSETRQIKRKNNKIETETETQKDLHKKLYASHFPFSKRMYSMFEVLDVHFRLLQSLKYLILQVFFYKFLEFFKSRKILQPIEFTDS
jgi:Tfp pilus assembly major pilin PilA